MAMPYTIRLHTHVIKSSLLLSSSFVENKNEKGINTLPPSPPYPPKKEDETATIATISEMQGSQKQYEPSRGVSEETYGNCHRCKQNFSYEQGVALQKFEGHWYCDKCHELARKEAQDANEVF